MDRSTGYQILKEVVLNATTGTDVELEFQESSTFVSTQSIKQLQVAYLKGNEYLRLDNLQESLRQAGQLSVFEYRGRGTREQPTLVADVDLDGEKFQLIYLLS